MSAGSLASVLVTLAVVLGIMGVALRFLRRYAAGSVTGGGRIRMEVVQRLALGQRQGIAVVRIGTRVLAVSMGEGGVRPVAELDETEIAEPAPVLSVPPAVSGVMSGFRRLALLRQTRAEEAPRPRISYVAPLEDFQAVLSVALGGKTAAVGGGRA